MSWRVQFYIVNVSFDSSIELFFLFAPRMRYRSHCNRYCRPHCYRNRALFYLFVHLTKLLILLRFLNPTVNKDLFTNDAIISDFLRIYDITKYFLVYCTLSSTSWVISSVLKLDKSLVFINFLILRLIWLKINLRGYLLSLLHDKDTYIIVKKNPIINIEKNLNSIITSWFHREFISKQTYFTLHSSDSMLPKAYGLHKIHKVNMLES